MSDFQIIGNELHYNGYVVARLVDGAPPSVASEFREVLDFLTDSHAFRLPDDD